MAMLQGILDSLRPAVVAADRFGRDLDPDHRVLGK